MLMKVAVAGASGYVGGELLRLLSSHPHVELGALTGASTAGREIAAVHPQLAAVLGSQRVTETSADALAGHEVVFLALPHGASAALAATLDPDALVIDCGADHRLVDPSAWERYYGGAHAGSWPYGLPELPGAREALVGARRIAVPGCYPTAATLAIGPAVASGVVAPDVVVVAASGTSGAGREAKAHLTSAEIMGAMTAYGVGGGHRHTPEMAQNLERLAGTPMRVSFTPMLAPMARGILATVSAPRAAGELGAEALREIYETAYATEPFVDVLSAGTWPTTAATLGANTVQVQAAVDSVAQRVVVVAALDNLTKGAAGAAVQSMNVALGLPETLGLPRVGVAP